MKNPLGIDNQLPQDLRKATPLQHVQCIHYLACNFSTDKLRRDQLVIDAQIAKSFNQKEVDPFREDRRIVALSNLNIMRDWRTKAIDLREFGPYENEVKCGADDCLICCKE